MTEKTEPRIQWITDSGLSGISLIKYMEKQGYLEKHSDGYHPINSDLYQTEGDHE